MHTLPVDLTQLWVGATVSTALFGLLGVALGALTRNTVTAIVGGIAWAMVIEIGILSSVAPEIGKWLPAGNALDERRLRGLAAALTVGLGSGAHRMGARPLGDRDPVDLEP